MSASSTQPLPEIEVTAPAREALLAHLARDPARNRYVRIHVGRG